MSQSCGACKWFLKLKNFEGNSGLCEWHDRRTDEDRGHGCNKFKRPKFNRNKEKKQPV